MSTESENGVLKPALALHIPEEPGSHTSSASTNISRVRVTSGQSRLKSAISRFDVSAIYRTLHRSLVGELVGRQMQ